jgi:hypothetical protein
MTPNDKQIDLLMRRFAPAGNGATAGEHLDADEITAFAEGSLPPAARARYVSHLADCDQCRRIVSQVTLSGAATTRLESVPEKSHRTFWQTLGGFFALPVLRYAAFAAVLLVVAGVAFVALRRQRPTELVAVNEPANQQPASATKAPETLANQTNDGNQNKALASATPAAVAQPTAAGEVTRTAETTVAPTTGTLKDGTAPVEEKKAAEPVLASKAPAYSPPPPGDQVAAAREQQGLSTVATRKAETDKLDRDVAKEAGRTDDTGRYVMNQPASPQQRARDEKGKGGPSRNFENFKQNQQNQTQTETRSSSDAPKTAGADERRQQEQEMPATRSVGGRTFRRQGPSWVDVKFKTSMSVKSVSRSSDEFKNLDSGLRSIAQQLGGEVLVVWKGQAYLIR